MTDSAINDTINTDIPANEAMDADSAVLSIRTTLLAEFQSPLLISNLTENQKRVLEQFFAEIEPHPVQRELAEAIIG